MSSVDQSIVIRAVATDDLSLVARMALCCPSHVCTSYGHMCMHIVCVCIRTYFVHHCKQSSSGMSVALPACTLKTTPVPSLVADANKTRLGAYSAVLNTARGQELHRAWGGPSRAPTDADPGLHATVGKRKKSRRQREETSPLPLPHLSRVVQSVPVVNWLAPPSPVPFLLGLCLTA